MPPGADEPPRDNGPGQLRGVPELLETGRSVKRSGGNPCFVQSTSSAHFYQSFAVSPYRTQQNKYLVAFVAAKDTPGNWKIWEMF
nr:MAG TPA: hypothetical protein [Caudoviricetes sp.]